MFGAVLCRKPHRGDAHWRSLPGRDAAHALALYRIQTWGGSIWRGHDRNYRGDDAGGSLLFSGRYNRGIDTTPPDQCWHALYTSIDRSICYAERLRHTEFDKPRLAAAIVGPHGVRPDGGGASVGLELHGSWTSRLDDRRSLPGHRPTQGGLLAPQEIASVAISMGAEALLVPSATRVDDTLPNVIIFSSKLARLTACCRRGGRATASRTGNPQQIDWPNSIGDP